MFFPETGSTEGEQQVNFCNICQKRFVNAEDLKKHNKNHLFSCSECNQAFNDQITLTKHTEEVCLYFNDENTIAFVLLKREIEARNLISTSRYNRPTHTTKTSTARSVIKASRSCGPWGSTWRSTTQTTRSTARCARRDSGQNGRWESTLIFKSCKGLLHCRQYVTFHSRSRWPCECKM